MYILPYNSEVYDVHVLYYMCTKLITFSIFAIAIPMHVTDAAANKLVSFHTEIRPMSEIQALTAVLHFCKRTHKIGMCFLRGIYSFL